MFIKYGHDIGVFEMKRAIDEWFSRVILFIKLLKRWHPWLTLAVTLFVVFIVVFVSLNRHTLLSPDQGYHLSMVHVLQGHDVAGFGLRVPPLYFFFLGFLLKIFPTFTALKVSTSFVSTIIALPFFFIARRLTKSDNIALFTTFLFVVAEGYAEMIGWGGSPNLFGIFFLLWSTFFTIVAVQENSLANAVLAGISMSLVVGAHHLTAFYYVLTIAVSTVWLLASLRRKALPKIKLLIFIILIGILFSLPYFPSYIKIYTHRAGTVARFNIEQTLRLLFGEALTAVGYIFRGALVIWAIIFVLGFFGLWSRGSGSRRFIRFFMSSFVLICFVLMFIISEHPSRPLYFLYIPILIAFSIFLSKTSISAMKKPLTLLFMAFLVLISLFLVASFYTRLTCAIDYYYAMEDETIKALEWLKKNTEPDAVVAVYDAPPLLYSKLAWWVEGYAERKAFMKSDLRFFVGEDQRQEVDVANKILSGLHVLENGYLRVSDAFPVDTTNPEVWINLGTWFQNIFFFTDSNITLGNAPRYIENGTVHLDHTSKKATITYDYMKNLTIVNRTVELKAGKPYVDVVYNVTFPNSTVQEFEVWAWKSFNVLIVDAPYLEYTKEASTITWSLKDNYGEFINVNVTLFETDCDMNISLTSPWVDLYTMKSAPAALFTFNATKENLYIKLRITVEPKITPKTTDVKYFNAYKLMEDYGIDYILLDKRMLRNADRCEGWWGEFDKQRLDIVFRNEKEDQGVLILKVSA